MREAFKHNYSRDTFCTLQVFLCHFRERESFYIREQDRVSFTALLISLILQQYKIGFKVELKYIKDVVVRKAVESADEGLFSNSPCANGFSHKYGK